MQACEWMEEGRMYRWFLQEVDVSILLMEEILHQLGHKTLEIHSGNLT